MLTCISTVILNHSQYEWIEIIDGECHVWRETIRKVWPIARLYLQGISCRSKGGGSQTNLFSLIRSDLGKCHVFSNNLSDLLCKTSLALNKVLWRKLQFN